MKRCVLHAVIAALVLLGCGDKGAAPKAPKEGSKPAKVKAGEGDKAAKPEALDPYAAAKAAKAAKANLEESGTAKKPEVAKKKIAIELEGPGPHQGFDLKAIHAKLQGTWLIGGSAFSSIPHIWHIEGSSLTIVDGKGRRSQNTFRLLAPCHMETADGGGSRTWHDFVFDGDTLYSGLGNAGLSRATGPSAA